jgi:uncharacterized protein (DUF302 family)
MNTSSRYGIEKTVELPFERAVERIQAALKEQGFGVLTEIDLKAKLKEKLGVDFKKYVILGTCNPPLAYRAVQADIDIGLLLPCNVIVYEAGDQRSVVSAIDPEIMMQVADNPELRAVAAEARKLLENAIAAVS